MVIVTSFNSPDMRIGFLERKPYGAEKVFRFTNVEFIVRRRDRKA